MNDETEQDPNEPGMIPDLTLGLPGDAVPLPEGDADSDEEDLTSDDDDVVDEDLLADDDDEEDHSNG